MCVVKLMWGTAVVVGRAMRPMCSFMRRVCNLCCSWYDEGDDGRNQADVEQGQDPEPCPETTDSEIYFAYVPQTYMSAPKPSRRGIMRKRRLAKRRAWKVVRFTEFPDISPEQDLELVESGDVGGTESDDDKQNSSS